MGSNPYLGIMNDEQYAISLLVRLVDESLEAPKEPDDEVSIPYGEAGFVVSTDAGAIVLSKGDDLEELLKDPFLPLASDLYGHIMLVAYGMLGTLNLRNGEADAYPARVIVGVTREGFCASAIQNLLDGDSVYDDEGDVAGNLRDLLIGIAKG